MTPLSGDCKKVLPKNQHQVNRKPSLNAPFNSTIPRRRRRSPLHINKVFLCILTLKLSEKTPYNWLARPAGNKPGRSLGPAPTQHLTPSRSLSIYISKQYTPFALP